MKKLFAWFHNWWLTIASLFLLAFIPLYPKLPVVDVRNTWVYVRAEDFVVLFVLVGWVALLFRNRVTLKTPLTLPILLFWLAGGAATLHSILLIVPSVYEIYPNVAYLSFLRRIEYMSLFFIAYSAAKDKRYVTGVAATVVLTVLAVILYGIGQKYLGLPAYLTMNEEFAKGIALTLSQLGRVSSTFGGHYDLAAYLVLTLPIVVSLMLGMRSWFLKALLSIVTALGVWVLFLTVSRISLFALLAAVGIVFLFQRKKLVIVLAPIALVGLIVLGSFTPRILDRFGSTIKEVDVLVEAKTGRPIGHIKEVSNTYFEPIVVWQLLYDSIGDVGSSASPSAKFVIPYRDLAPSVILLTEPTAPTGEDLPSGTGYINLTLSKDVKRIDHFLYEPQNRSAATPREAFIINGEYLIKRAYAYDLSFTTRFQGEWPKAVAAFQRNVFIGSGYGSVSLAVDNSYLRMLAEVGVLGFASFLAIFLMIGIVIHKTLPKIDSPIVKSLVWGYVAGVVGLSINAIFIDVFEASKVAFVLWLLTGAVIGILTPYLPVPLHFFAQVKRVVTSSYAIVVYLLLAEILLVFPLMRNYFIGDDFTWFRWASACESAGDIGNRCVPQAATIMEYFTKAQGFFYRPGAKVYFAMMYWLFWLNQSAYHFVSLFLHFLVSVLVFVLSSKVFRKISLAALAAFLFVSLNGFSEAIFWISATGYLFAAAWMLLSVLLYSAWRERKHPGYFIGTWVSVVLSLLFHEMAVITPLLLLVYERTMTEDPIPMQTLIRRVSSWVLLLPLPIYAMRLLSQSHWFAGDYNVNLVKFPLNAVGNALGYVTLAIAGPFGIPVYEAARTFLREHMLLAVGMTTFGLALLYWLIRRVWVHLEGRERRIVVFASLFSLVSLLPFLGLGNITSRYGYLGAVGFVLLLVFGLDKLRAHIAPSGRAIAVGTLSTIVVVWILLHSVGWHQLHKDWYEAGEMVKNFFVSMDSGYQDYWATSPMEFYFVNVPIRHREAWVFPVGIDDALWFVFRNPRIRVYTAGSLESALSQVTYGSPTQKVFVFDGDGRVSVQAKQPPTSVP